MVKILEDKELLLKDLCARLPYRVRLKSKQSDGGILSKIEITGDYNARITITCHGALSAKEVTFPLHSINDHLLYLRPMSSMTEEEKKELGEITCNYDSLHKWAIFYKSQDWLNARHFDYRGLIEKNLALDCTGLNVY